MRAWIMLGMLMIAIAIRPELNQPHGMGKAQFGLFMVFFFGGLYLDILELILKARKK